MEKLKEILEKHLLWINNKQGGERANLSGANLSGANLSGADLSGANLSGAIGIYLFNKGKGRTCYAVEFEDSLMIKAGCFWGTLSEFAGACIEKYGNDEVQNYMLEREYLQKKLIQIKHHEKQK
jgi:hypothetical protein